jgi:primosomal protein N' (replication factor Y)
MSQVAGRAGRRGVQGKVIIQTYNVQHPVFHFLLKHDYDGFYQHDIGERIEYKYPPFFKLIKIILRHENIELVKQASQWMTDQLRDIFDKRVLGPEAPPIARIRNKYIMNILLKFERQNMNMSEAKVVLMREVEHFRAQKEFKGVRLVVDVDPY